jgi:hypothetical protein
MIREVNRVPVPVSRFEHVRVVDAHGKSIISYLALAIGEICSKIQGDHKANMTSQIKVTKRLDDMKHLGVWYLYAHEVG